MLPAILATVATVFSAVAVALLGYFGSRLPTLESQRSDFNAVLQPLRDEIRELRDRVSHLEGELRAKDRKYKVALRYIADLLTRCAPPVPPVPQEIFSDL